MPRRCHDAVQLESLEISLMAGDRLTAQIGPDNDVTFVVSPDLVNFTRPKVMDLIGTGLLQIESNKNVSIDKEDFVTACTVLPTLTHGHVIGLRLPIPLRFFSFSPSSRVMDTVAIGKSGFSRSPPGEIVLDYEELLLHKYGLGLSVEHFLKVKFTQGGFTKDQWFEWNFFDGGYLKIKIRNGEEQPVYKKRACTQLENADMTTRVVEQYMRHQLESLTVSELKSFLSAKNAKVGGRKEELIMRNKDDDVEKTDDCMFVLELVSTLENEAVQA
ncbi:hypothetical protein EJ110_NYTH46724 [Nymphaea thermarum]|nr:hypothetical protein EJ110_NYTH46724 [Nymphaea thermarum]